MSTHYSRYAQDPILLNKTAERLVRGLKSQYPNRHYVLTYTGLSGITLATAMATLLHDRRLKNQNYGMIYVRKENEVSHSREPWELANVSPVHNKYPTLYVAVDDFIDKGTTLTRLYGAIKQVEQQRHWMFKDGKKQFSTVTPESFIACLRSHGYGWTNLVLGDNGAESRITVID